MSASRAQKLTAWSVPLCVEALALARSVLLARLIGPEELGKAIMLALVLRLVEMLSDLGVERLLVQAPEGATERLQASLQGALLLRGMALALVLLALSPLLGLAFADGPQAHTYAALALVPFLRGFLHLDYRRAERIFNYRPLAIVELGAAAAMLTALGAALAAGLADHRVLPIALAAQAASQVALSHRVAHRRWQLSFERAGLMRAFAFGAPLALNAGLMFLTLQADRLIVAAGWSWSDLAIYGVAAQLAMLPAQIFGRAAGSLLLPALGRARDEARVETVARAALSRAALAGLAFALVFTALAPAAIGLVYGAAMAPSFALAAAFAAAAGLRIARTPLSVLAVATGRTADTFRANSWRAAALLPGLAVLALAGPLSLFAATSALGEAAAALRGWQLAKLKAQSSRTQTECPA
ncbi:oligosaccharide flippase family protein [Aliiruegeria sabulilitoris]|uniref:oligosaccharide flippase family protein n=1 Tax=Aliiruegeria sabulilitoris TaxID=1510458 RepID=UPI00082C27F3|nr:oligosaccharide flippase family protein [Aliiruegeria sabulilitoris]